MKKVIKNVLTSIGLLLICAGIFVCTWETEAINDQITILVYGAVSIVVGAVLCLLNGGEEDGIYMDR